jgi:hypothetical protein
MSLEELKQQYGAEYPAAIVIKGIRMPLKKERRFSRSYHSAEHKMGGEVSRFMDDSASITLVQLQSEWPAWTEDERMDFCNSCDWLRLQPDFPEMLRFVMQHGSSRQWPGVAMSVAYHLPQEESFDILLRALGSLDIGKCSNITQAIALTKHPNAESTLRNHLEVVWAHKAIWEDDEFLNWVAYDAMSCIQHLIELGASSSTFEEQVRQLSQHQCARNRQSCARLSAHYPWLG